MFNIFPMKNGLENVEGFYFDGISAGLKKNDALDMAFIRSDAPCDIEAVFTTNKFQAAPLRHYQKYPKDFKTNFILINAKNANAMTGEAGIQDIDAIFDVLKTKIAIENPIMSSTGVIGYRLPKEKITASFDKFDFYARSSENASKAIMTTDSFSKELALKVELEDGNSFHIAGICKGAGMINPAMATMLCFIITDADIPKKNMNTQLVRAADKTFNAVSVDGDTSTNDTVLLLTNRKSGAYDQEAFQIALEKLMHHMALEILRDGEGANKVVAFEVKGAKTREDAVKASKALSNSLLVKTALFGEDPNWGRIASTIGASGCACSEESLIIKYDNLLIYSKEQPSLNEKTEQKAFKIMKQDSFKISCDLGMGDHAYTSYGCDLSYEYVKINADYRT